MTESMEKGFVVIPNDQRKSRFYTDDYSEVEEVQKTLKAQGGSETYWGTARYLTRLEGIVVNGYIGKWYVIDAKRFSRGMLFLLESETFGDETSCLIVDDDFNLVLDDVWNGFDDYCEEEIS